MEEIGFFCTDGDYTPRIYFAHSNGDIEDSVHCPGREEMKFLYLDADVLIKKMEEIIKHGLPTVEKEEL